MRVRHVFGALVALLLLGLASSLSADWRSDIEADWIVQEERKRAQATSTTATTEGDALGAIDGIKEGRWGFHAALEASPWWMVDLGEEIAIGRIVVYNRGGAGGRSVNMLLSTSLDGETWTQVHDCGGQAFGGTGAGEPLAVTLDAHNARFVKCHLPGSNYFHLDEVEVYASGDDETNVALWKTANQSSVSPWSVNHPRPGERVVDYLPVAQVIKRGDKLSADLAKMGVDTAEFDAGIARVTQELGDQEFGDEALYAKARWLVRDLALKNPLLDFDQIVFSKRKPTQYSHMSDQYYGWWSKPGGGLYTMSNYKSGDPELTCITDGWPEGTFLRPELSHDGSKILFAFCKYYLETSGNPNKVDKASIPEDAFYHVYEMNVDGSGVRQLTRGRYDDFDARCLPNGDIVFLSTRRGVFVQCTEQTSLEALTGALPDSYVRCGGGPSRPVAVYTLHTMSPDGSRMRAISPFENFEWTPSVTNDGRITYARWDYVDRSNMPYMSLWSTRPDGTHPEIVYGNFTHAPHAIFEARAIPNSKKMIFTASAHHSVTGGSLTLLDTSVGVDGTEPITRLTPEVCFPEIEGWPASYYANPFPLSEDYFLCSWSHQPLKNEGSRNPDAALGIYYYDAFGNLELIYRDPDISSMYPLALRSRPKPPIFATDVDESKEGRVVLLDVYNGLAGVERGAVKALRIVGVPAKTQPTMNAPRLGITRDDPGKFVLGTVPVEADGSAHFHAPAGVGIFFQALDENGMALQTMRSLTYLQPNQTLSCVGCHEGRNTAPTNMRAIALNREPSRIKLGPEGSWPMRFDTLVKPVLDEHCISCHAPGAADAKAAALDLTGEGAYDALINYGNPSLFTHISSRYGAGRSVVTACAAQTSQLLKLLRDGHHDVELNADDTDRLVTWMDTYAQRLGSFSDDQEQRLEAFKSRIAALLKP